MSRHVVGVTLDNLEHLPLRCRRCVYWELAPHMREQVEEYGETEVEKEAWISAVLLEWGSCGRIAYSEDLPVGFVLYAPPNAVPRASAFPTAPVSADAIMLTSFFVLPEFRSCGLGRMLVQAAVQDLTRRGVKAVEAFGDEEAADAAQNALDHNCVVPADFLRSVGFKTVAADARWPRMRLELRAGMSWKEDVEAALEQLLGQVSVSTVGSAERSLGRV
ncbi:GNAT family N-acetyltransferase [Haloechinothrix sp. YIM 98757]|uniref:GNAT family N-acetyltransferase n=1 Tax=Haloechinothrix aidingensis TaxID=2752311 RepID=A0A837ZTX1_9PSEU|nr:GNAT family N-acetyltransferase [Haloechinothrix aidingensis]